MWGLFHQDSGMVARGKKAVPEYHQKNDVPSGPISPSSETRRTLRTPRETIGAVPGFRGSDGERSGRQAPHPVKEHARYHSATRDMGPCGTGTPRSVSRAPYEWMEPTRSASTDSARWARTERTFSSTPETRNLFRFEADSKPKKQEAEFSNAKLTRSSNDVSHTHRFDGVGDYGPGSCDSRKDANPVAWAQPRPGVGKSRACKIELYNDHRTSHKAVGSKETPRAIRPPPSTEQGIRTAPSVSTSCAGAGVPAAGSAASPVRPSHDKSVPSSSTTALMRARDRGSARVRSQSENWLTAIDVVEQSRLDGMQRARNHWSQDMRSDKRPILNEGEVVTLNSPRRVPCRKSVPGCQVNQRTGVPPQEFKTPSRKVVPGRHVSQVSREKPERARSESADRQPLNIVPGLSDSVSGPPQHARDTPRQGNALGVARSRAFQPPKESVLKTTKAPVETANRSERITRRVTQPKPASSYVDMLARQDCGLNFSKDRQFRPPSRTQPNPRSFWGDTRTRIRHSIN